MINWGFSILITTIDSSNHSSLWNHLRISSLLIQTPLHYQYSTYHQSETIPSEFSSIEWSYSYILQSYFSNSPSSLSNEIEFNWSESSSGSNSICS